MANIINGTDTGSGGLITTGDSSDELQLQTAETARVTLTNTAVVVNEGGDDVDFRVESDNNANMLFVDAGNDRVGVGTDSPGYFVEASRSQDTVTNFAVTNASTGTAAQTRLRLNNSGSNFGTITHTGGSFTTSGVFRQDGTYVYSNGAGGLTLVTGAAQPIYFAPNSTERVRIDSDGLKFNGDTAAANALDDYEEGTWTPTFSGAVSNPTVTYTFQTGYYTKIGRQVFVSGLIGVSAFSGGSGNVFIAGLPFTVGNVSQNYPVGTIGQMTGFTSALGDTDGQLIVVRPNTGTTDMSIYESNETNGSDWATTNIGASFFARFSASYFV